MAETPEQQVVIAIEGLSIRTHHGVTEAEREIGQQMLFDVVIVPEGCLATETDRVEDTIDYGEATERVVELATETGRLTLERLVRVIADDLLDRYPARAVTVRATKPEPPIPFTVDGTSVEITLTSGREGG